MSYGFSAAQMRDTVWVAVEAPFTVWDEKLNNIVTVIAT